VLYTPGVNHTTVAEHTFALLLALHRNLIEEANHTAAGRWKRITGRELFGKTLGVVGFGRIGREVTIRARAFGLKVVAFGNHWDERFADAHGVERMPNIDALFAVADIVSLHTMLNDETRGMVNAQVLAKMGPGGNRQESRKSGNHEPETQENTGDLTCSGGSERAPDGPRQWAMRDSNKLPKPWEKQQGESSGGAYGDHRQPGAIVSGSPMLAELVTIAERLEAKALSDLLAVARGLDRKSESR
jgi:hypothetical protein